MYFIFVYGRQSVGQGYPLLGLWPRIKKGICADCISTDVLKNQYKVSVLILISTDVIKRVQLSDYRSPVAASRAG